MSGLEVRGEKTHLISIAFEQGIKVLVISGHGGSLKDIKSSISLSLSLTYNKNFFFTHTNRFSSVQFFSQTLKIREQEY